MINDVHKLKNKYQADLQVKYKQVKYVESLTGMPPWDKDTGRIPIPRHMAETLAACYKWMLKPSATFFHYETMQELMEGNYATGSYITSPTSISSAPSPTTTTALPSLLFATYATPAATTTMSTPAATTTMSTSAATTTNTASTNENPPVIASPALVARLSVRSPIISEVARTPSPSNPNAASNVEETTTPNTAAVANPSSKCNASTTPKKRPHYKRDQHDDDGDSKKALTLQDVYVSIASAADKQRELMEKEHNTSNKDTDIQNNKLVLQQLKAAYTTRFGMDFVMKQYKSIVQKSEQKCFLSLDGNQCDMDYYFGIMQTEAVDVGLVEFEEDDT
jgi:hypothetical protein